VVLRDERPCPVGSARRSPEVDLLGPRRRSRRDSSSRKPPGPVYLVINVRRRASREPSKTATCSSATRRPRRGQLIAARAINSAKGFVYIRGEYVEALAAVLVGRERGDEAGLSETVWKLVVQRGAGAYICGERPGSSRRSRARRAGRSSSRRFQPSRAPSRADHREQRRDAQPRPAHHQSRGRVVRRARHQDPGRHADVLGVGRVARPAVYEAPVGITLRHLIYERRRRRHRQRALKAVVPGGSRAPFSPRTRSTSRWTSTAQERRHHGGLGGCHRDGRDGCRSEALMVVARFYAHESCGQ